MSLNNTTQQLGFCTTEDKVQLPKPAGSVININHAIEKLRPVNCKKWKVLRLLVLEFYSNAGVEVYFNQCGRAKVIVFSFH